MLNQYLSSKAGSYPKFGGYGFEFFNLTKFSYDFTTFYDVPDARCIYAH